MNLTLQFLAFGPKLSKPFYYEKMAADYPEPKLNEGVTQKMLSNMFGNRAVEFVYEDVADPYSYMSYLMRGGDIGRKYLRDRGFDELSRWDLMRYNAVRNAALKFARKVKPRLPELKELDTHQALSPLATVGLQTSGKVVNPAYGLKDTQRSEAPRIFYGYEKSPYVDYNAYRTTFGLDKGVSEFELKDGPVSTYNDPIKSLKYGAPYAAYLHHYGSFAPQAYELVHGMKPLPYDIALARKVIENYDNKATLKGLIGVNDDGTPIYKKPEDKLNTQPKTEPIKPVPPSKPDVNLQPTTGVRSKGSPAISNEIPIAPIPRLKPPPIPKILDESTPKSTSPSVTAVPKTIITPSTKPAPTIIPHIKSDDELPTPRSTVPITPKPLPELIRPPKITPTPTQEYTPRITPSVSPKYTERNDNDYKPLVTENTPKSIGVGTPDKNPPIKDPSYTVIGPGGTWQVKRYGGY